MSVEMSARSLSVWKRIRANLRTYMMIFTLLFIWVLFGFLTPTGSSSRPATCPTCSAR